jgi:hypothetical protein
MKTEAVCPSDAPVNPYMASHLSSFSITDKFMAVASNIFSLLNSIQTGSGAHPASCPMGTGGAIRGDKGAEA